MTRRMISVPTANSNNWHWMEARGIWGLQNEQLANRLFGWDNLAWQPPWRTQE